MSDWVDAIGKPAADSVAAMVACLLADRERLRELRGDRDDYAPTCDVCCETILDMSESGKPFSSCECGMEKKSPPTWAEEYPEDAAELAELEAAVAPNGEELDEEQARERIEEDPLSLRVFGERIDGEWMPDRFELLLAWGGPAVRIVGELDDGEPISARLEVQDWGRPWTQYYDADSDTLLDYCRCFYYGG